MSTMIAEPREWRYSFALIQNNGAANKSLDASGTSGPVIDNLSVTHMVSPRVNSNVTRRVVVMRIPLLATALFFVAGSCLPVPAQRCLEYGPTVSLTGRLHSRIFPGPPNYQSIRRGDRKETALL